LNKLPKVLYFRQFLYKKLSKKQFSPLLSVRRLFTEHQKIFFPIRPWGSGGRIPPVTNNCRAISETLLFLIEPRISPTPIQPQREIQVKLRQSFALSQGRDVCERSHEAKRSGEADRKRLWKKLTTIKLWGKLGQRVTTRDRFLEGRSGLVADRVL
jgi:hypothetical protein